MEPYLLQAAAFLRDLAGLCDRLAKAIPPPPAELDMPTPYQAEILKALEGRALRTEALAAKTSKDRRSLFTERGLKGLVAAGRVRHCEHGYYRPDAPPG